MAQNSEKRGSPAHSWTQRRAVLGGRQTSPPEPVSLDRAALHSSVSFLSCSPSSSLVPTPPSDGRFSQLSQPPVFSCPPPPLHLPCLLSLLCSSSPPHPTPAHHETEVSPWWCQSLRKQVIIGGERIFYLPATRAACLARYQPGTLMGLGAGRGRTGGRGKARK